jgi:metal-responsive CopG/Arc/MetJ family transcriptional regulator
VALWHDARMKKMPIAFRFDPALLERLDAFIAQADVPVARTAVIETAVREFLDVREGRARQRRDVRKVQPEGADQ